MAKWIEWHGGECPVPAGTKIDVKFRDGKQSTNLAGRWNYCWENDGAAGDIIAYRIHTDALDESIERDAERYRWLRQQSTSATGIRCMEWYQPNGQWENIEMTALDAAIDEAMKNG